jgi:hypothetical protein
LACSNLLVDKIEITISIPSLSKFVYDSHDFHLLVVYPIFLIKHIGRGMNSFSFSLSVWMTYLHICCWYSIFGSTNPRLPHYLLRFLIFYRIYTLAIGWIDLFDQWYWDGHMNTFPVQVLMWFIGFNGCVWSRFW